ncbi:syncytin-A-like [Prinia subflava]|uniref:syncytin-A-like n=1 Tax=Prinia subflava TaxID=208062 RepID=UPI002FE180E5
MLYLLALLAFCSTAWPINQPKTNVWITLANATKQDTLCLATASPENPFSTCLVGLPLDGWPIPEITKSIVQSSNPVDTWDQWTPYLPITPLEPQELELLGSVKMDFCVNFDYTGKNQSKAWDVSPYHPAYKNQTSWCNYTSGSPSKSSNAPLWLPSGMFLICGDRAWAAIPSHIKGGPCSLGRLTVLTPNMSMILQHKYPHRIRRTLHAFDEYCDDELSLWSETQMNLASSLLPGMAAKKALSQLNKVACWLAKQTNATSSALSNLLTDVDSIRHATLQNRAAIDFILLAQGHGCEDFDGMCCMNLSDHSESIHKSIQQLKDSVFKLKVESGSWLDNLFSGWGLTPWLKDFLRIGMHVMILIIIVLVMIPCLLQCVQRLVNKAIKGVFLVNTEGGDLGIHKTESQTDLISISGLITKMPWQEQTEL